MIAAKLKKFLSEYVPENELGEDGRPIYKYVEMLVSVYCLQRRLCRPHLLHCSKKWRIASCAMS